MKLTKQIMCDSIWATQSDKAIMYGVLDSVQEINRTLEKIKMPEKKIFIDFDQYSVRFSVCRENDYSILCEPTNSYDTSISVEAIKKFICGQLYENFKFEFIDKISLEKYQYDIVLPKDAVFYKVFSLSNIQEFYVAIWEYDKYLYDKFGFDPVEDWLNILDYFNLNHNI